MVLSTVRKTIERYGLIDHGDRVLVAVSGGVDSIVLLDVLRVLSGELDFTLHVAHVDHALRAETSRADARFVEHRAEELGLPFASTTIDRESLESHRGLGPEGAAREVRRSLLLRLAEEADASKIALGHTASDSAETVLHHLVRGAGGAGLRGVPAVNLPFIRPLSGLSHAQVLDYAVAEGLTWREDGSNTDLAFTRNRLRHRVLPELERINPQAVDAILRASELVEDLHHIAEAIVEEHWGACVTREQSGEAKLSRRTLAALTPEIQRLLLREAMARVRGDLIDVARAHIEAIRHLAASDRAHGELSLPRLHVRMQGDEIALVESHPEALEPWTMPAEIGETEVSQANLVLSLIRADRGSREDQSNDIWTEIADADRIAFPLEVRSRREGDRFSPLGLGKETKLKDFLINERIPYFERDRIALLCDRDRVLWVIGVRLSHEVRVTDETKHVLRMRAEVHA